MLLKRKKLQFAAIDKNISNYARIFCGRFVCRLRRRRVSVRLAFLPSVFGSFFVSCWRSCVAVDLQTVVCCATLAEWGENRRFLGRSCGRSCIWSAVSFSWRIGAILGVLWRVACSYPVGIDTPPLCARGFGIGRVTPPLRAQIFFKWVKVVDKGAGVVIHYCCDTRERLAERLIAT